MSDSSPEENKPALSSVQGNSSEEGRPTVSGEKRPLEDKSSNEAKLPFAVKLVAIFAFIALAGFAVVIANQLLNQPSKSVSAVDASQQNEKRQPVSILPLEPEGVTVLAKQPEIENAPKAQQFAPVAQGADVATGFAMDVGAANSFIDLSRKFSEIATLNGVENFRRLEPRAILRETVTGLEARLLIGPFESETQAQEACAVLILPEEVPCMVGPFEGDLISRE